MVFALSDSCGCAKHGFFLLMGVLGGVVVNEGARAMQAMWVAVITCYKILPEKRCDLEMR